MIITHLMDGLGNQLFQYAVGRALADRRNTQLKLDLTQTEAEKFSHHGYYQLGNFNVRENFATLEDIRKCTVAKERVTSFIPGILDCPNNTFLYGYWQSEKYFSDIADILRQEFTLKKPLEKNSDSWREKILQADCAVSLHIRHGDYIKPMFRNHSGIVPIEYYRTCVDELKKISSNLTVFIFSNDLIWAKKNLELGVPTEFVEGCEHDYEEMYLMSLCKHNIVANSTFSWWSAWLNQNPDKKIFVPYPWHRDGWGGETIIPESWIKMPVDYDRARFFAPSLSIIVYIENSMPAAEFTCKSIFSNYMNDYEVIFVDASTDTVGQLCRNFAAKSNVSFLKVPPATKKSVAWNVGLSCARGDYVLFLTGKEIVLSHTVSLLCRILEFGFDANNFHVQKNYEAYIKTDAPDIICAVKRIEDNDLGKFNIGDIPNKRFSISADAAFQNINAVTKFSIDGRQKLTLLATNRINNLIGTKFFKREFLLENKITFDEKIDSDKAELLFLTDSFMRTEKIILLPQIFCGRIN